MLLAIVPARGGSKGVPRKNMRLIRGRPLLDFTLSALVESGVTDRLLVSSDDPAILTWAELHGYETHVRSSELADDHVTISDVAAAIADELDWQGEVGVFQPTSPLRSAQSIVDALAVFRASECDSLASCVRQNHLFWYEAEDGRTALPQPLFAERVNRQYARSRILRETGAIQLARASSLRASRQIVTSRHELFELPDAESLDIDTYEDLSLARRRLEQATIVFRLRANHRVGSGHLFHCLQLAEELDDQHLAFLLVDCDPFVSEMLDARGFRWRAETNLTPDLAAIRGDRTNVVVNDVLDTHEKEILQQRAAGFLVINIEDLGPGSHFAHWVVNALYRAQDAHHNASSGPQYATLREEFHDPPPKELRQDARRVLITFGGTDPNHLAHRCATLLAERSGLDLDLRVVRGPGSKPHDFPPGVQVVDRVRSMASEMLAADVILTSAGRTIYEAAITATPVVVLAQNAREATHAHLGYETGVIFLGIGPLIDDGHIVGTVERLLADCSLREELSDRLRRSVDTRGTMRIANRIRAMIREHE
jgi:CMP-N-acetylneuraminic acid synthetase/spore coat polysaccharide biosynthesis predicted glycosyltransferase SpsG